MHLIVSAVRGSGGAISHLRHAIPRLIAARPGWRVEVHASPSVLEQSFGRTDAAWMRPLRGDGYADRLRWELFDLPSLCVRSANALVFAPFGPVLNVDCASRSVFMSRNIIPLLEPPWEVSPQDVVRLRAVRSGLLLATRLARGVICVSEHGRRRLAVQAGRDPEQISVVPHGVESVVPSGEPCADAAAERVRTTDFILSVGQPVPYRRTRELIEAYRLLRSKGINMPRLVLVGSARPADEEYDRSCDNLLQPLIAEGNATRLLDLNHGDVMKLTAVAHTYAHPSIYEDCPNAVLEALAMGRVLLCADIPACRELANDAAVYFDGASPASLAQSLLAAASDDLLRVRQQELARARAALFSWDNNVRKLTSALERAADCR